MHPKLKIAPICIEAGSAMHVGRPKAGAPLPTPARFAASLSSIAPEGLQANKTTSGATGTSPNGAYTIAAGALANLGICGTSSGFTYPNSNIIFSVCSVSFSLSGDKAMLCVYAPTAQLK